MKYEKTAYRLREALNDIGMSQIELSEKAKINKSSISHYVLGRNEPASKSAYAMAKVLRVNPACLHEQNDRRSNPSQVYRVGEE